MPKLEMSDIDVRLSTFCMSESTRQMLGVLSEELGISKSRFVELAILSVTPKTKRWKANEALLKRVDRERHYIGEMRRKITRRKTREKLEMTKEQKESELKEAFLEIINKDIKGRALDDFLKEKGLELDIRK